MEVNSTSNLNQHYFNVLEKKQQETTSGNFQEEFNIQNTSRSLKKTFQPQDKQHELFSYSNTKNMTTQDIDEYFSGKTDKEKEDMEYLIKVSSNFSENDIANEVIFEEAKSQKNRSLQQQFLYKMSDGLFIKGQDKPPIVLNLEWFQAKDKGISNPEKMGIYLTPNAQYNYENKTTELNKKLSEEEGGKYFLDMARITKEWMEKSEGYSNYDYYKKDYEMYLRMSNNYHTLLEQKENSL